MNRDLKKEFCNYLRVERGLSANTLEAYQRDLNRLERWALAEQQKDLLSLSRSDVLAFLQHLKQEGLDSKSIARATVTLRNFFKFLVLDGMINHDPTVNLDTPRSWQTLPKFLALEEINLLLSQPDATEEIGIRDRAILELLYATGMRASELVALKVSDVNLEMGLLYCMGKGSKERSVPLGRSAIEWLKRYLLVRHRWLGQRSSSVLMITPRGKPMTRQMLWKLVAR